MMKRRNYLICSIIAMLSIVSYACETEYAICEGCGTSGDFCKGDTQRCAESLNGKQVCSDGKWGSIGECMGCYNKNTDNSDAASLVCNGCEPNKYELSKASEQSKLFHTKVCYNGELRELKPIEPSAGARTDNMALNTGEDKDVWEFVLNEEILDDNEYARHFNCHGNVLKNEIIDCMNNNDAGFKSKCELKCCNAGDYYIKHTGYKYYSIEMCRIIEVKGGSATFTAYKYTDELNDSLIGKKKNLPYSLCYNGNLLIAHNNNFQKNNTLYKSFECPSNYGCNEKYDELCVNEKFEYNDEIEFKCKMKVGPIYGGESIIYDETSVAKCPDNTKLKIQNKDGSWSDCKDLKFKLNQARCVPMEI